MPARRHGTTVGETSVGRRLLRVVRTGPLATIQDLGRPGLADLGVGRCGACDRGSLRLANRLVGNPEGAAAIEVTAGGLVVRAVGPVVLAVTGAPGPLSLDGHPVAMHAPLAVARGGELALGTPASGLRTYVAVRGGLAVEPTLGSRSTDLLAGLGPPVLAPGDDLEVGDARGTWSPVDVAPVDLRLDDPVELRVTPGPRADWFLAEARTALLRSPYEVLPASNRIGVRLTGTPLARVARRELPSEGLVAGALQVPHSGLPTLMLADHPVTGGYPVIAVVVDDDLDAAGQLRAGQRVRFTAPRRTLHALLTPAYGGDGSDRLEDGARSMSGIDKAKNAAEGALGKAKEALGKTTDDEGMEAEGKADQSKSDLKQAGEKVKDAFKS